MELRKIIFLVLTLLFMTVLTVSFSTKGSHWEMVSNKSGAEDNFPQVYRSLEGLITLDILLFVICLPILFCFHKQKISILKYLLMILFLLLNIRFIMSIFFLAGDDSYCWKMIQEYNELPDDMKTKYGQSNFFTTLSGAWGFEIFTIVAADALGIAMIVFILREIRYSTDVMRN